MELRTVAPAGAPAGGGLLLTITEVREARKQHKAEVGSAAEVS